MTANQEHIAGTEAEEQQLFISGRIWHELYPKVDPGLFLRVLGDRIDLTSYGKGISKFYFTFVVMEKLTPNFAEWVGSDYYPDRASVDIGIRVPYQEIVDGDETVVIRLMEEAFLAGIDTIAEHELNAPFDHLAFKADVEAIFAEEKWYKIEDAPA